MYNASNNELVRTNTLVKGAIIQVDAAPFRQWYEAHVSIAQKFYLDKILMVVTYSTVNLSLARVLRLSPPSLLRKLSNLTT